jgi:uncharacterized Zn finger protein
MNCEKCLNQKECGHAEEEKPGDHYFHVGEKVELKGRIFRVKNVKPSELRLRLIPGCVLRKSK